MQTLAGWRQVLPADAVFTGPTAAWLLGLDLQPTDPVHVAVPLRTQCASLRNSARRGCNRQGLSSDVAAPKSH